MGIADIIKINLGEPAPPSGRQRILDVFRRGDGTTAEVSDLLEVVEREAIDAFYSHTLATAKNAQEQAEAAFAHEKAKHAGMARERDAYLANLTSTQARCTELLNAKRLSDHFGTKPGDESAFLALAWNLTKARAKHPRGPDGMRSLGEELGEVANAIRREPDRIRDELLDLAVVAMRLYMGDHAPGALEILHARPSEEDAPGPEVSR